MNKYYKVKEHLCPICNADFDKIRQVKQHMIYMHNKWLSENIKVKRVKYMINGNLNNH